MSFVAGSDRRDRWTLVGNIGAEQLKGRFRRTAVLELLSLWDAPLALEARAG